MIHQSAGLCGVILTVEVCNQMRAADCKGLHGTTAGGPAGCGGMDRGSSGATAVGCAIYGGMTRCLSGMSAAECTCYQKP
jgi:hypothetical protein